MNLTMRLFKKNKQKQKTNIFAKIEGEELSEMELKQWLSNATTLKMLKVLKAHRKNYSEHIITQDIRDVDMNLARGRCRGYDDIIELIEETASNQEDLEALIKTYIENRNAK